MALRDHDRTGADTVPLAGHGGGARGQGPRPSALGTAVRVAVLAAAIAVIVAVVLAVAWLGGLRGGIGNPFAARDLDRSQPVLLQSIEDLAVYQAATGNFQVVVDLERDAPFLPRAIKGERTLFVAAGTVDAQVDFSKLGDDAIRVSDDRTSVEITLTRPALARPRVDPGRSYVADRQRGLLDRLESVFEDNPTGERELYALAEARLAQAATETELVGRAEANTRSMLTSMMTSLGFTSVEVTFVDPGPGPDGN